MILILIIFIIMVSLIILYNCFMLRFVMTSYKMFKQMKVLGNAIKNSKKKKKKYNKDSGAYQ